MAASASSQHRCVFVGNIPYDATEEQLIQICEEVGPVVSFRLVIDRETGKPKGYGFCEYKDEETALSARRNLQGYEINGRQLRVDFAENDKNADRNKEQGRGGPGFTTSADASKHPSGLPISSDPMLHQPMGLQLAATAASMMASALGGAQIATAQNRLQSHPGGVNDPLSVYLSRFSRHQLNEILSEMKALGTQNKTLALQIMQGSPQLSKALFQVQIMLGLVTPQMMQIVSQQPSGSSLHLPSNSGQAILQKESLIGLSSTPSLNQVPVISQNPGKLQQSGQHIHRQPHPQLLHSQGLQATFAGKSGTSTFPPALHQSFPLQHASLPASKALISQNKSAFLQQPPASTSYANLHYQPQPNLPNTLLPQPILPRPNLSQTNLSNGLPPTISLETLQKEVSTSSTIQDSTWHSRITSQDSLAASADPRGIEIVDHPSKFRRLEDGSRALQIKKSDSLADNPLQTYGAHAASVSQVVAPDTMQQPDKHAPQLTSEVEAALLQQVLSLTPEQLSSLTSEQQQQVLQLQKMLSASK